MLHPFFLFIFVTHKTSTLLIFLTHYQIPNILCYLSLKKYAPKNRLVNIFLLIVYKHFMLIK